MEIACPNCAKRFRLPAEKLGPKGRKLRCAGCAHVWFQAPPPEAAAEGTGAAAAPATALAAEAGEVPWPKAPHREEPGYDRPPIFDGPHLGEPRRFELSSEADDARRARGGSRAGLVVGWLLLLLVVAGLVVGGWYYRNQIVEAVPELRQIYDLLDVPLETGHPGVVLEDVTTQVNTVGDGRVMTITGRVGNVSDLPREVPMLVATVTDKTGAVLVEWRFDAGRTVLRPGEELEFETRREAIPRGELSVRVDFVLP
ncbi:MAG: DUF3426 domain-containing protein [Tistlia sp.]|uniref:DUF3426 domain-containing protein n=1 Tax=Tistlia sp. TaxID=3057121 RepID=UPI0034A37C90